MGSFTIEESSELEKMNPAAASTSGIQQFKQFSSGAGSDVFKANQDGIFAGADNFEDAPFSVTYQGVLNAETGTFSGDISSGATITGATIQTGETGFRTVMTSANGLQLYNNATQVGYIKADTAASLIMNSDDNIYLTTGVGEDQMAHFTPDSMDIPGDYAITWAGQGRITPGSGGLKIEGATGGTWGLRVEGKVFPDGDNEYDCGDPNQRWAKGWFEDISVDDLDVNNSLDKPGGSFKIDHPLKPETHILRHSFIESPEMMNIYKGRGKTVGGKCKIKLPDYFESLNKDIEYQLTPIGSLSRLGIFKEIESNEFEVISEEDCDFSWAVLGVRQDKFAEENRIIVEEEKEEPGYMYGGYENKTRNSYTKTKGKETLRRKMVKNGELMTR